MRSKDLDLTHSPALVENFFRSNDIKYVVLCAAKVGGIVGNRDNPVDYIDTNMRIEMNVMKAAHTCGIKKLIFTGSACAYPKLAQTPIKEELLLTGSLEPTNKGYALAKILGHELCRAYRVQHDRNFISCLLTNVYGPGDHYNLQTSHVIPGMIRRIDEAKDQCESYATLWGDGTPRREFLYSTDVADAIVHLMYHYDGVIPVNVGYGCNYPLSTVAELIKARVGYPGFIKWNTDAPNGTPNRLLDTTRLFSLGWRPQVDLEMGLAYTYNDYLCQKQHSSLE